MESHRCSGGATLCPVSVAAASVAWCMLDCLRKKENRNKIINLIRIKFSGLQFQYRPARQLNFQFQGQAEPFRLISRLKRLRRCCCCTQSVPLEHDAEKRLVWSLFQPFGRILPPSSSASHHRHSPHILQPLTYLQQLAFRISRPSPYLVICRRFDRQLDLRFRACLTKELRFTEAHGFGGISQGSLRRHRHLLPHPHLLLATDSIRSSPDLTPSLLLGSATIAIVASTSRFPPPPAELCRTACILLNTHASRRGSSHRSR